MSRSVLAVFLVAILGVLSQVQASTNNTAAVKLSNIPVGKTIKIGELQFVKVNDTQYMTTSKACIDELAVGGVKNFSYTGDEQTFQACAGHAYKLEVWGAQGGSSGSHVGGYGGYSIGVYAPTTPNILYVVVGGKGVDPTSYSTDYDGGYNGGGKSYYWADRTTKNGSGGGATHISLIAGILQNQSSHATDNQIVIVAGGGGGGASNGNDSGAKGGDGGGYTGNNGEKSPNSDGYIGLGGSQSSGGSYTDVGHSRLAPSKGTFGKGGDSSITSSKAPMGGGAGGGGGYYGAGGASVWCGAGGGSGYIASANLISSNGVTKQMKCYNCATSTAAATYTVSVSCANANHDGNCANTGNGYARITRLN